MRAAVRIGLVSADSHVIEPPGCYVDHIDPRFRDRAPHVETGPNGGAVVDTRLAREAETWNPTSKPDAAPYRIIQGSTGLGLNLDGKIGPNDFTSPLGDKGIDNQLYRAIGCTRNFRADGETAILTPQWRVKGRYNTYVIDGLPPGPIANPGRASLEAAANPARTKEIFFVADGTGGHAFAENYETHQKNVARLRAMVDEP